MLETRPHSAVYLQCPKRWALCVCVCEREIHTNMQTAERMYNLTTVSFTRHPAHKQLFPTQNTSLASKRCV